MVTQIQTDADAAYKAAISYMGDSQDRGLRIVAAYASRQAGASHDETLAGQIGNINNDSYSELVKMLLTLSDIGRRGLTLQPEIRSESGASETRQIRPRDLGRLLHYESGIRGNIEEVPSIADFVRTHKQDLAFTSRNKASVSL